MKTDRRDAEKLARSYRRRGLDAGVGADAAHEALRDLVRAREAAKKDQLRARHRLSKFLLRHGRRPPAGMKAWTERHLAWVQTGALRASGAGGHAAGLSARSGSRGRPAGAAGAAIDGRSWALPADDAGGDRRAPGAARDRVVSAVTIVAEVGHLSRFTRPAAADGLQRDGAARPRAAQRPAARRDHEDRERAPPAHRRRGRVGVSAPTGGRRRAAETPGGGERGGEGDRVEGAHRLHARYRRLLAGANARSRWSRGRPRAFGFIWAIGVQVEREQRTRSSPSRGLRSTAERSRRTGAGEQRERRSRGTRKGGPSRILCGRPRAGSAMLVRGSSRRITIMAGPARPANIRVINRRAAPRPPLPTGAR